MATFDDFKRVIRETLQVDSKDRVTPQEVKFINRKNEFYGKFIGDAKIYGLSADGSYLNDATIVDAKLSNITVYASDGTIINLSSIADLLYFMGQDIETLSTYCLDLSNTTGSLLSSSSEISSKLEDLSSFTEDKVEELSNNIESISSYIDILSTNYDLTGSNISIITKISQDRGLLSIEAKNLMSSDIDGLENYVLNEIGLSVHNISGESNVDYGRTISKITQSNGKVSIETRDIVSADVTGLSDFVKNEIKLSVDSLDFDELVAALHKIINKISQNNGKISASTRDLISSDVIGLPEYVANEVKLSVNSLTSRMDPIEHGTIVSRVVQNNGIISVLTRNLLSSDVNGLPDYVSDRISTAISDIKSNNHIEHGLVIHNFGQVNGVISADYRQLVSSDISGLTEYVENKEIESSTNLSNNLTGYIDNNYLKKSDFNISLSNSFNVNDLYFDSKTQRVELNVQGKKIGFDAKKFVEAKVLRSAQVITDTQGNQILELIFEIEGRQDPEVIDIKIKDLLDIHTAGYGINIQLKDGKYEIGVDYSQISNDVSATAYNTIIDYHTALSTWRDLTIGGHVTTIEQITNADSISSIFKGVHDINNKIFNSSVFPVEFSSDLTAETKDGQLSVCGGDFIIVHDHTLQDIEIDISKLNNNNVKVYKSGVSTIDIKNLSIDITSELSEETENRISNVTDISNWLSANFVYDTSDLTSDLSVRKDIKNEHIQTRTIVVNNIESVDNIIMRTNNNNGWRLRIDDSLGVPSLVFDKVLYDSTLNIWTDVDQ